MHMGSSMNKHESKYFNTALLMNEALIRSLDKKDYEYITVKEICDIAGVNRSTFYLHYETMEDLLLETIESMFNDLKNRYTSDFVTEKIIDSKNMDSMKLFTREYSIPYLSFLKEHKKAFMVAINPFPSKSMAKNSSKSLPFIYLSASSKSFFIFLYSLCITNFFNCSNNSFIVYLLISCYFFR